MHSEAGGIGAERSHPSLPSTESSGSAGSPEGFGGQPHAAAYSGSAAGVAVGLSHGIANRGRPGVDAHRSHHGAGKTQRQRTRAQGFDAGAHGSRAQLHRDAPAALRAAKAIEESDRGIYQLAGKFPF